MAEIQSGNSIINDEKALKEQFPFLEFPEEPDDSPASKNILEIWQCHEDAFELFQLAVRFLQSMGGLDAGLLTRLIDERNLPLENSLWEVQTIYSSWYTKREELNGNSNSHNKT